MWARVEDDECDFAVTINRTIAFSVYTYLET